MRKKVHIALLLLFVLAGCQPQQTIRVLHAGSLSVPLKVMAERFMERHPGVVVQLEGAGSLTCIRKITDLGQSCDVLAVADYALIDELMIPDHTSYNLLFAGNEMAIGYLPGSVWERVLTTDNWPALVLADSVSYGRSDPDHDPSGYRTILVASLAEDHFDLPGFRDAFSQKDQRFVRPKGTELLPLLETGAIDLVFHYRSVLVQHELGYLRLPDSLNLSHPDLQNWYQAACIDVRGTEQDARLTRCGEAMIYGVCQPVTSENPEMGSLFIQFMLDEGRAILDSLGQPPITPQLSAATVKQPAWFTSEK